MLHWGLLSAALCFRHSRSFNRIMVAFNTEKPSLWTLACAYVCLYWLGFRFLHVQHLFTLIIKWINSFWSTRQQLIECVSGEAVILLDCQTFSLPTARAKG